MNMRQVFNSRRFRFGAISTAISVIFVALIVVVNIVATVLTQKFPLQIDLTPNSAFNLTSDSIDFVKELKKPVSVTVLAREGDLESSGNIYLSQIKSVIDQYAKYNQNITVKYVDIVKDPTFVTQYPDMNLTYYDVLLVSGERTRSLSLYDMFNVAQNQQTGRQYIRSSKAEEMMTSAIMGVTSEDNVRVGILSGHEEASSAALQELLEKNNFDVVDVNLTSAEEIDPTIDVLFLNAPKRDPDAELIKKLDTFLNNGQQYGKMLYYAASTEQPVLPNFEAFLADWGIGVDPGAVLETNNQNILNFTSPYFCTVEYVGEDYMDNIPRQIRVTMPFGRPLRALFDAQSGYQTTELLSYSDTACVYPPDAADDWQPTEDKLGAVPALIRSTHLRYEGSTPLSSYVFAASSSSALEASILQSKSVSNADYLLNTLNTVTQREDVISIAPKDLSGDQLGINQLQSMLIAGIMVVVIPLLIIVAGLVVWMRRRHR